MLDRTRPAALAPPYARVKQHLADALCAGTWPPGALMPSEAALVAQFGVSRMTVNRALRELQAEGRIERVQGVGTFAAAPPRVAATLTIRDLHEEIAARGHRHDAQVLQARREKAPQALAAQLGLRAGDAVFHTLILHLEDGLPLQLEDRYVNPAGAPGYLGVDFTRTTPTAYLLEVAPSWEGSYSIEAAAASTEEARWLGIGAGEPCLVVVRATRHRGQALTIARLVHPGRRYLLQGGLPA